MMLALLPSLIITTFKLMTEYRSYPAITAMLALLTALPAMATAAVAPFVARYEAYYDGGAAGTATMQVAEQPGQRWKIDLNLKASRGMAWMMGLSIEQSTVFDQPAEGQLRPLSQRQVQGSRVSTKRSSGRYDWQGGHAQWTGDIKPSRQQPIALQPGDMDGLLINLALTRDAAPGRTLNYRYVDGGRMREHRYRAAARAESIQMAGRSWQALRVERNNANNDGTIVWVAEGMPIPLRIVHRKNGKDEIDLRLIDIDYAGSR